MKIRAEDRGSLVKEIMAGIIHRDKFPEVFPNYQIRVLHPGYTTPEAPPLAPLVIPEADRRRLAKQVMKGEVSPDIWPDSPDYTVTWPDWND